MYSNPELTQELVKLSGWQPDEDGFSVGYLLRKCGQGAGVQRLLSSDEVWIAVSTLFHPNHPPYTGSDTPEDAIAKLAIELFKQGILKP